MCFVRYHGLYILCTPEVEPLLLAAALLSGEIQVFHDDAVHIILYGRIHDEPGGLDRNVIVNAFCLFPESRCFTGTEFLCVSDVAYRMLQRVVFSRKGKKFPSEDRALRVMMLHVHALLSPKSTARIRVC